MKRNTLARSRSSLASSANFIFSLAGMRRFCKSGVHRSNTSNTIEY